MEKVKLTANVQKQEFVWETELQGSPLGMAAARKGFQEWLNDASSTAKIPAEHENDPVVLGRDDDKAAFAEFMRPYRIAAVESRLELIKAGTYAPQEPSGSRGSLSLDDKGILAWLETKKYTRGRVDTGKISPKTGKLRQRAETCQEVLSRYITNWASEKGKEVTEELTEKFLEIIRDGQIYKIAAGLVKEESTDDALDALE